MSMYELTGRTFKDPKSMPIGAIVATNKSLHLILKKVSDDLQPRTTHFECLVGDLGKDHTGYVGINSNMSTFAWLEVDDGKLEML